MSNTLPNCSKRLDPKKNNPSDTPTTKNYSPSENANSEEVKIESTIKSVPDKNFRLQSKRVFFTFKHHIPFYDLINFIELLNPIHEYVICHEIGDESHDYEHTHITIEFKKKLDITSCRHFDYVFNNEDIHPNICTTRNWPASCTYCLKQFKKNPSIKNWDSNFDVVDFLAKSRNKDVICCGLKELCVTISKQKNKFEAIKNVAGDLKEVTAICAIYDSVVHPIDPKQIKYLEDWEKTIRPWQKELCDICCNEPDRRNIYWIVDEIGGQGKSDFCSYMDTIKKPDSCLTIASTGSLRDIADVIRNSMDQGMRPEIILIDLPRTFAERDSIYTIIESVKNGRLTCTKYKGATLKFFTPHVLVFSNWYPVTKNLSMDRWKIMNLVASKANDPKAKLILLSENKLINLSNNNNNHNNNDDIDIDTIDFIDDDFGISFNNYENNSKEIIKGSKKKIINKIPKKNY
jgi:hypothetical protein